MTAKELIDEYKSIDYSNPAHNSMGCSENWYDSYYAICNTFSEEKLLEMGEPGINDLIKLADTMGGAFY